MATLMEQFMQDAETPQPVSNKQFEEISKLAQMQLELEASIDAQERVLSELKDQHRRITEVAIPTAMESVGLASFTLYDGSKLTVREEVYASVRKDHAEAAYYWLDKMGLGDIIKGEIKVTLGRGEHELAGGVKETLHSVGIPFTENLSVHSKTLSATVKEQLAKGIVFPDDLFSGTVPVKKTVIKKPKGV